MDKHLIHVIVGPTASGKTDFALKLAKDIDGELINVDSRQIYKHIDIGTNKGQLRIKNEELKIGGNQYPIYCILDTDISLHLVSFLDPDQQFNAFDFRDLVYGAIEDIQERGKTPILVGGSGLYLNMILYPKKYRSQVGAQGTEERRLNTENREKLNSLTKEELQHQVKGIPGAWESLNASDKQNPRRLIRAIEKASVSLTVTPDSEAYPDYKFKIHHIDLPMSELEDRINRRVNEMFKLGIVAEVKHVLDLGYPESAVALQGIGYREVLRLIHGEISGKECIRLVQIAHRQYAKRQKTWFKKFLD